MSLSQPFRDALDLFYLTGQRVADTLKMDERDINDGTVGMTEQYIQMRKGMKVTPTK